MDGKQTEGGGSGEVGDVGKGGKLARGSSCMLQRREKGRARGFLGGDGMAGGIGDVRLRRRGVELSESRSTSANSEPRRPSISGGRRWWWGDEEGGGRRFTVGGVWGRGVESAQRRQAPRASGGARFELYAFCSRGCGAKKKGGVRAEARKRANGRSGSGACAARRRARAAHAQRSRRVPSRLPRPRPDDNCRNASPRGHVRVSRLTCATWRARSAT